MELFLRLLLAHMLGDFVFQSAGLVALKKQGYKGLLIHAGVVTFWTFALTWGYPAKGWAIAFLLSLMHLASDWARYYWRARSPLEELASFLGDQLLHIGLIMGAMAAFGIPIPWGELAHPAALAWPLKLILALILFIFLIWVVPLLEKMVVEISPACSHSRHLIKVEPTQRFLGAVERVLALIIFIKVNPLLALLAFIPRIFTGPKRRCALYRAAVSLSITLPAASYLARF
ncbi:MAG: DUF3307 domain-containing protein [Anaerolineae bacterium]|nr:DUF3307 domain-containing protein [Anaerolineae bacterium]MDW8101523.1 DUF3307 domain-containing protein [Anaerolineae bacterium]